MNYHTFSASLKAKAREQLLGHYMAAASAFFLLSVLQSLITAPVSLLQLPFPINLLLATFVDFLLQLFFSIFQVGLAFLFLSNACNQPVTSGCLFAGFMNGPGKAISIWFVPALFLLPVSLLENFVLLHFAAQQNLLSLLFSGSLLSLLSLPYVLYIQIRYSQVFYVMLDFPEMTAVECRRYAVQMMKGQKGRFLYLQLSFLPLLLLGSFTCGLSNLFVRPYEQQTYADFYLELAAQAKQP